MGKVIGWVDTHKEQTETPAKTERKPRKTTKE